MWIKGDDRWWQEAWWCIQTVVLSKTAQGAMGGEDIEQIDVGQDWVCFDVEKEHGG